MNPGHKSVNAANAANAGRKGKSTQAAKLIPAIARKALRHQGFACSQVITHWAEIAGRDIAMHSVPVKLNFPPGRRRGGTLHVKADTAFALELQHRAPRLVERINRYYGYGAVERIAILQAPPGGDHKGDDFGGGRTNARPSEPDRPPDHVRRQIGPVRDPSLKDALLRLGGRIFSSPS